MPTGGFTDVPHTGMRRAIARRLTESKTTIPHFYLSADCRMDALFELRKTVNEFGTDKVSVNDFVVKAVARRVPRRARGERDLDRRRPSAASTTSTSPSPSPSRAA